MAGDRTAKKKLEKCVITRFVRRLGYQISQADWDRERPDAVVVLREGTHKKSVALENTEYYSDAGPGKSSYNQRLERFWGQVQDNVADELQRYPLHIDMVVYFKETQFRRRKDLAKTTAKELVALAERQQPAPGKMRRVRTFNDYPELQRLMKWIRLTGMTFQVDHRCGWTCANLTCGHRGTKEPILKNIIEKKTERATGYHWPNTDEKWLLISASGSCIANQAGPAHQYVNWKDEGLLKACNKSPFDRIFFYQYYQPWHRQIWPYSNQS